MAFLQSVLSSIVPLAQSLAKTHQVSIVAFDPNGKKLVQTGVDSQLNVAGCNEYLWQQARRQEAACFDKVIDGSYISAVKIFDNDKNCCMLLCMSRTPESSLADALQNELIEALARTVQSCLQWAGTQRSTVIELMEKYEELTLLYDISERLECLPSFDEVANEML